MNNFKHFAEETANDVQELCAPLFKASEIHYFHYIKIYDNCRLSILTNKPDYTNFFIANNFQDEYFSKITPGLFYNETWMHHANMHAKNLFNIDFIIMFSIRMVDHYEIFGFGTSRGNARILNFYLHHLDALYKFGLYFKVNAEKLIKMSDKHFILCKSYKPYIIDPKDHFPFDKKKFIKEITKQDPYFLRGINIKGITLSKRQSEILYLSIRGKNAPEIAKCLRLSKRTVSHYLEAIKSKMGVSSKSELIEKVIDYFT